VAEFEKRAVDCARLGDVWHPNKNQWWVIWIAVLGGILFGAGGGGLLVFGAALLVGILLVWQLEGKRGSEPKEIFCGECGTRISPKWQHCPTCGSQNWKTIGK
jgi:hypothetical protein